MSIVWTVIFEKLASAVYPLKERGEAVYIERPASLFDIRPVDVNEIEDVSERHDDYLYEKL